MQLIAAREPQVASLARRAAAAAIDGAIALPAAAGIAGLGFVAWARLKRDAPEPRWWGADGPVPVDRAIIEVAANASIGQIGRALGRPQLRRYEARRHGRDPRALTASQPTD